MFGFGRDLRSESSKERTSAERMDAMEQRAFSALSAGGSDGASSVRSSDAFSDLASEDGFPSTSSDAGRRRLFLQNKGRGSRFAARVREESLRQEASGRVSPLTATAPTMRGTSSTTRNPVSSSSFDIAENARLALEAKDAQLNKMAARLAELERQRDAEMKDRVRTEVDAFSGAANDLEAEMANAMKNLRSQGSGSGNGSVEKFALSGFASRDDDGKDGNRSARMGEEPISEALHSRAKTPDREPTTTAAPRDERAEDARSVGFDVRTPEPGTRVEGGVLTSSGRIVASALKTTSSVGTHRGKESISPASMTQKNVVFNREEAYSDAGVMLDPQEIDALRAELREVRQALKSAFGVSEKLVAQCEKKNRELKEKNLAIKLAREEVERAREEVRIAKETTKSSSWIDDILNEVEGDARLRVALETLNKCKDLNAKLLQVMKTSIGVNAETSPGVVFNILPTVTSLATRGDVADAMVQAGALIAIANSLDLFAKDVAVCRRAMQAVGSICRAGGSDASTQDDEIVELRVNLTNAAIEQAASSVLKAVETHLKDAPLCELGCDVVRAFVEYGDLEFIKTLVEDMRVIQMMCEVSQSHPNDERAQRASSLVIAALATTNEQTKEIVERSGGFALVRRCAAELGIDDALRVYPAMRRWLSGKKTKEELERDEASTRERFDDVDDDFVDNL